MKQRDAKTEARAPCADRRAFGAYLWERFREVCRALRDRGFHDVSPWWMRTIKRWLLSGRLQLVARVGRRGGKSTTFCALGVTIAVHCASWFSLPLGDIGVIAVVSVDRREARGRIRTMAAMLDALDIEHREVGGEQIDLPGRRLRIQVFTATVAGVSGFTAVFVFLDEVAKWKDRDTGANPATEVIRSIRPTLATQPHGLMVLSSSPVSTVDAHYAAFEEGDTETQLTAHAPTWEANPTITEAETHALEPDEDTWRAEYAAIPLHSRSAVFRPEHVEASVGRRFSAVEAGARVLLVDPSAGGGDTFAWAVAGWVYGVAPEPPGQVVVRPELVTETVVNASGDEQSITRYRHNLYLRTVDGDVPYTPPRPPAALRFFEVGGWEGRFDAAEVSTEIARTLVNVSARHQVVRWISDGYGQLHLAQTAKWARMPLEVLRWTADTKANATRYLRTLMADGELVLPNHDALMHELLRYERRYTPSGQAKYGAPPGLHDDYASLLMLAANADAEKLLSGSAHSPPAVAYTTGPHGEPIDLSSGQPITLARNPL